MIVTITRAAPNGPERAAAAALLADAGLPTEDLQEGDVMLWTASGASGLAGCVGLEIVDTHALLRSLAVSGHARGQGLGDRLLRHALDEAARRGAREVWALALSDGRWFLRRGFVTGRREALPPAIAATRQAAGICPGSALVLRHTLSAAAP